MYACNIYYRVFKINELQVCAVTLTNLKHNVELKEQLREYKRYIKLRMQNSTVYDYR